jgi:hypothetical protein
MINSACLGDANVLTRDAPDTIFAGYPANPKAGYRISGRIPGRILGFDNYIFGQILNKVIKSA